jgi:hypothetical protein
MRKKREILTKCLRRMTTTCTIPRASCEDPLLYPKFKKAQVPTPPPLYPVSNPSVSTTNPKNQELLTQIPATQRRGSQQFNKPPEQGTPRVANVQISHVEAL